MPLLSTISLAQTLDRYSETLLNIIMSMFGKCEWAEKRPVQEKQHGRKVWNNMILLHAVP